MRKEEGGRRSNSLKYCPVSTHYTSSLFFPFLFFPVLLDPFLSSGHHIYFYSYTEISHKTHIRRIHLESWLLENAWRKDVTEWRMSVRRQSRNRDTMSSISLNCMYVWCLLVSEKSEREWVRRVKESEWEECNYRKENESRNEWMSVASINHRIFLRMRETCVNVNSKTRISFIHISFFLWNEFNYTLYDDILLFLMMIHLLWENLHFQKDSFYLTQFRVFKRHPHSLFLWMRHVRGKGRERGRENLIMDSRGSCVFRVI